MDSLGCCVPSNQQSTVVCKSIPVREEQLLNHAAARSAENGHRLADASILREQQSHSLVGTGFAAERTDSWLNPLHSENPNAHRKVYAQPNLEPASHSSASRSNGGLDLRSSAKAKEPLVS